MRLMEETEVQSKPVAKPHAPKKDSPNKELLTAEGAQEIKVDSEKWTRAPLKVVEPTF
jgi:hypothetical protein